MPNRDQIRVDLRGECQPPTPAEVAQFRRASARAAEEERKIMAERRAGR